MLEHNIVLPSKPKVVLEEKLKGVYEIDGLYAGYGHTLGNSLRRIILSSLPGFAITSIKIDGVSHEFSTMEGGKEDVINIILNLKKIRFKMTTDEPQTVSLSVKKIGSVVAKNIKLPSQVEILNEDQHIAEITNKDTELNIEITVEKGLGYVQKESLQKGKVDIGTIVLDAIFTPIRRVNYEVENMRVGDRTDYNRLKIVIETDGTIDPRAALEDSIAIMIKQLKAIVGFKEDEPVPEIDEEENIDEKNKESKEEIDPDVLKTRIDTLDFSSRTSNAMLSANIRTLGGLARKKEEDLLDIDGLGNKGIAEIKKVLNSFGIALK